MKTNIGLLVGGLVLLLGSTASASTLCGTVGSANNANPAFTQGTGNFSVSGGAGTITCSGLTVPAGDTLMSVTFLIRDDAQGPVDSNSQITFVWTYSGQGLNPTPSSTVTLTGDSPFDGSFAACQTQSGGTINCNANTTFSLTTGITGPNPAGTYSFTVTPSVTGPSGDGFSGNGGDSAQVFVTLNYVPTTTVPEPASMLMIGSGLVGLGVFARRKRQ